MSVLKIASQNKTDKQKGLFQIEAVLYRLKMNIKRIIDKLLFYISVPRCVGCGERLLYAEKALCKECLSLYLENKERECSLCAKKLSRCTCSNEYLSSHYVKKLVKVFRYRQDADLPSNKLIYSLKADNRRDVLDFLSSELCEAIESSVENPKECIFTNVPRRRREVAKFGIDHAELLAKSAAKHFSATYYQPIISKSKRPQKMTEGSERLKNARFQIKRRAKNLDKKRIIIIDDVVTTGASMSACAMLYRALGTKNIIGATLSIAYKDNKTPFETKDRFLPKF